MKKIGTIIAALGILFVGFSVAQFAAALPCKHPGSPSCQVTTTTSSTTTTTVPTTTTTTTTTTVPTGTSISHFSDLYAAFEPEWDQPPITKPHFMEVSTPYGPGFQMIADSNDVAIWDSADKAILAVGTPVASTDVEHWHFRFMLPSSGNLSGIQNAWFAGVLFEFHSAGSSSGIHLAIDGRSSNGGPRLHFSLPVAPWGVSNYVYDFQTPQVQFNHWYTVDMNIGFASDSSGFFQGYIDGQLIANHSGIPTNAPGDTHKLQFGYYSYLYPANTVQFAEIIEN